MSDQRPRAIEDIVQDIVSCADEMDGGKLDAREYCVELIGAVEALAASPAPPDDLVALVREWQRANEAYGDAETPEEHEAAGKLIDRARSELLWWPRHPREDMPRWDEWHPAPTVQP